MRKLWFFSLLACVLSGKAVAEECFSQGDIDKMLNSTMEEFCGGFDNTGSNLKLKFDGKIDIDSMGLFKKIAGELATGVKGSAISEEFKNVQRKDLANDKENTRQCNIVYAKMKMEMFKNRCK